MSSEGHGLASCVPRLPHCWGCSLLQQQDAELLLHSRLYACRAKTDKRREVPGELLERVRILSAGFAKSPDMSRMSYHRGRRYS